MQLTAEQRVLVEEHLDLVDRLARRQRRRTGLELDELVSSGRMGLVEAAQRFDSSRGVPFGAYAGHRVLGSMRDAGRKELSAQSDTQPLAELHEGRHAEPTTALEEAVVMNEHLRSLKKFDLRTRRILFERLRGKSLRVIGEELGLSESRVSQITGQARTNLLEDAIPDGAAEVLTPAQLETLRGAAQGETTQETAGRLGKSVWTVRSQRKEALRRLGARSTTHALARALLFGVLSVEDLTERWGRPDPQT